MAVTLWQRVRLWLRGSSRRREERDREFLDRNASWGAPQPSAPPAATTPKEEPVVHGLDIDRDGLQAAYFDQSGVITYYLDTESGEVVDVRDGSELAPPRYRRVPTQSDDADRAAFLKTLDLRARAKLQSAPSFRAGIATDRTMERAWYNFKTQRAVEAIEKWIASL